MKQVSTILFLCGLVLAVLIMSTAVMAGTVTSSMGVTVGVAEYLKLVLGPALNLSTANGTISSGKISVSQVSNYTVTTNRPNTKLSANLVTAMPTGVELNVIAGAPTGATSAGKVVLDTTVKDLVTGIAPVADSKNNLTFNLLADMNAPITTTSTNLVFTLTAP